MVGLGAGAVAAGMVRAVGLSGLACGASGLWLFFRRWNMRFVAKLGGRLVRDEQGGEVLEYALIAGLIVVAAIAVITSVGTKVLARWTSTDSAM
jgi:Flp pilus assembly pilin Flp